MTREKFVEGMKWLRDEKAIGYTDGSEMTDERIEADADMQQREFSYYKECSIRMRASGHIISRYNAPGYACTPRKFNVYRVSGNDTTYPTLTAALQATGFDMNLPG